MTLCCPMPTAVLTRAALWTRRLPVVVGVAAWAWGAVGAAQAQTGIYTCVDAQGRRITSDRPIRECIDREQRELNPSGSLKRVVPPVPTAEELAREEARKRAEAEALAKQREERRKEQLLLMRFPTPEAHQRARSEALHQVQDVIDVVRKRAAELDRQRQDIEAELEFYKRDPSKAPEWLKRRQAHNAQQRASQAQYLDDQAREKTRINARFDEELKLLQRLWAEQPGR